MFSPIADLDIIDLFKSHQHKMCKDERDHVFALLGILTEGAKHAGWNLTIQPDYQATVPKVYTAMASDILRTTPNLDMLCLLRWSDRPEIGLPSWVPDWRSPIKNHVVTEQQSVGLAHSGNGEIVIGSTTWSAGGDKAELGTCELNEKCLTIGAKRVGTITAVYPELDTHDNAQEHEPCESTVRKVAEQLRQIVRFS